MTQPDSPMSEPAPESRKHVISVRHIVSATLDATWPDDYSGMSLAEALEYERTRDRSGEDAGEAIAWGDDFTMSVEVTSKEVPES